jgi:hypothetical protein
MTETIYEKQLTITFHRLWQEHGTPANIIEVGSVPRPTGGIGLCVNFLPTDNTDSESMIRLVISNLIETGITKRYSGLQFAVSKPLADITRNVVVARYFLDSDCLRSIERNPSIIEDKELDALVTTKVGEDIRSGI